MTCLHKKWSSEQIADQVGISHETIYRQVYADKAAGGTLWEQLRCQKKREKRYASGRDRRGKIVGRRPISERPQHIEARFPNRSLGRRYCVGVVHKQAIVTLVECKSGYALLTKVSNKTSDLVSQAIITKLNAVTPLVKALTFEMGENLPSTLGLIRHCNQ